MLVAAILLLGIMMTIALAVVAFSDVQQNQSRVERVREASFQLTEAAMQGQIFQLGRRWPGAPGSGAIRVDFLTWCTCVGGDTGIGTVGVAAPLPLLPRYWRTCPCGVPAGPAADGDVGPARSA